MSRVHTMKRSRSDRMFYGLNTFLAVFALFITLYPILYIISASLSSGTALTQGRVWLLPVEFTLDGYEAIVHTPAITRGFINAAVITLTGTSINVAFTVMAAYPLSRKDFCGRSFIVFLFMFTMMFSGGMIPSFLLVKNLHMLNTIWALVIPGATSVWNMAITMNFFRTNISGEMLEAAQIDGCNDIRFLLTFVIPLSKSILAVIALFYAVSHWNSYFSAMIYLSDTKKYPLQLVLRDILVQNQMNMSSGVDISEMIRKQNVQDLLKYSVIVFSSIPMMLIYPFMQKHLVKGVMMGSLKG